MDRFLIVGLGNTSLPGTRHNVGMMAIDWLVRSIRWQEDNPWTLNKRVEGYVCDELITKDHRLFQGVEMEPGKENFQKYVYFLKGKGFMNFSGRPVLKACKEFQIPHSNVLVLHDDLERKMGLVSRKFGGSTSGHNGLKSIHLALGTTDFGRVRIGIDRPVSRDPGTVGSYVLTKFGGLEVDALNKKAFPQTAMEMHGFLMGRWGRDGKA
ncbi:peptidyl-tRNA hydrolase [Chytridium lagenaria]|nr:peptidyl-tRNA hydrolase [Chytridium lagenaria]